MRGLWFKRWRLALAGAALAATAAAVGAAEKTLKFDCGTANSPVMQGYERLTGDDAYSAAKGYGWEGKKPESVVYGEPEMEEKFRANGWQGYFEKVKTNLSRDGVSSVDDIVFRADVSDGRYRVAMVLGDMSKVMGSVKVTVNGEVAANPATGWMVGGYRSMEKTPLPFWTIVRHTVDVKDGAIRIALSRDPSYYDMQMEEQMKIPRNPYRKYWWDGSPEKDPPYWFISYPFTKNGMMGLEIAPEKPAPVTARDDKLALSRPIASPALNEAIALFNAGKFADSLAALKKANEPEAQVAASVVKLWLAGRLEIESEEEIVPAALETLKKYSSAHPEETGVADIVTDAGNFMNGLTYHLERGKMLEGYVEKNHFIENDKAMGWFWLVGEGTPLYYKSQLYWARCGHMLSPYIPVLGEPAEAFKRLERKFPDNRHVKYYLHWKWEPFGDGTHKKDWVMIDRTKDVEGAPEWVQALYPAWATLLDWSEWFIKFKQTPQGSIGGGSGDDVEIIGAFGYLAYTSLGSSDILIPGTSKLVEWIYSHTTVDPEAGFCLSFADAEHSAEWTGNTLGMMCQIDYGNPLWIERSMKTGKLIRDLWTDYNKNEMRQFRSNHFGAARIGSGDQMNDSWIDYRAVRPASAVLWFNNNPTIGKLYTELADTWVKAALSTDRGKPNGVIPAEISFPDALIGGINSPNWHTATHTPGTVNYDFAGVHGGQGYKSLLHDILESAYLQTRDAKYLEPLKLEYQLTEKYGLAPKESSGGRLQEVDTSFVEKAEGRWKFSDEPGTTFDEEEAKKKAQEMKPEEAMAEAGTEKWVAQNLKGVEAWLTARKMIEGRKGPVENDTNKEEIVKYARGNYAMVKARWPLMTTESSATDRTAFGGVLTPFLAYTGGKIGGPLLLASITYENIGRNFCAAVLGTDPQGFRLLFYSLAAEEREVGLVPWDLEPGGTYELKYGPDNNDDDKMDSVAETRTFELPQRGTPVKIKVKPRQAYVVEVEQTKRGQGPAPAPDPGLSAADIRFDAPSHHLLARIHNVGSKSAREVEVAAYEGNPKSGGKFLGNTVIPNIEAPIDLEPRSVTVGFDWSPEGRTHDIYIVIDPDNKIADEITSFNNSAHKVLPEAKEDLVPMTRTTDSGAVRGRR